MTRKVRFSLSSTLQVIRYFTWALYATTLVFPFMDTIAPLAYPLDKDR